MHKYFIDGENLETLKVTLTNVLNISEEEMYKRINKIPDDIPRTRIDKYIYELFSDKLKSTKLEYIYAFHMTVGTNEIIKSIKNNNLVNRDKSILILLKDLYKNIKPNISENKFIEWGKEKSYSKNAPYFNDVNDNYICGIILDINNFSITKESQYHFHNIKSSPELLASIFYQLQFSSVFGIENTNLQEYMKKRIPFTVKTKVYINDIKNKKSYRNIKEDIIIYYLYIMYLIVKNYEINSCDDYTIIFYKNKVDKIICLYDKKEKI